MMLTLDILVRAKDVEQDAVYKYGLELLFGHATW